jgi:hypothetical protein
MKKAEWMGHGAFFDAVGLRSWYPTLAAKTKTRDPKGTPVGHPAEKSNRRSFDSLRSG